MGCGGEGCDRETSQAELQLSRAASWLFREMQAEVDFLCPSINQWPDRVSSVKAALIPSLRCY